MAQVTNRNLTDAVQYHCASLRSTLNGTYTLLRTQWRNTILFSGWLSAVESSSQMTNYQYVRIRSPLIALVLRGIRTQSNKLNHSLPAEEKACESYSYSSILPLMTCRRKSPNRKILWGTSKEFKLHLYVRHGCGVILFPRGENS